MPKNIQFINDSGPPATLLPSGAYVDITTPAQGINLSLLFIIKSLLICQCTHLGGGFMLNQTGQQMTTGAVNKPTNVTASSSTHITAPSEVSQSTAISDRPKVKPVSKKDGKNLRKVTNMLQSTTSAAIINQVSRNFSSKI